MVGRLLPWMRAILRLPVPLGNTRHDPRPATSGSRSPLPLQTPTETPDNDFSMSKPRIIGGIARGRTLETPRRGTRPSPSRLREALFDILAFREPGTFLDLFSGSGAIGLEAASRGWQSTCVDLSREAAAVIGRNARLLGLEVEVVRGDALDFVKQRGGFDVVFAAPPYPLDLVEIFSAIFDAGPAAPAGIYIFQHPSDLVLPLTGRVKRYGSNALTLIERASTDRPG